MAISRATALSTARKALADAVDGFGVTLTKDTTISLINAAATTERIDKRNSAIPPHYIEYERLILELGKAVAACVDAPDIIARTAPENRLWTMRANLEQIAEGAYRNRGGNKQEKST